MFKTSRFSDKGSNVRTKEESAYMMFVDYLHECEKVYFMQLYLQIPLMIATLETDFTEIVAL